MERMQTTKDARAMAHRPARPSRWPRLLVGTVLLWRALCAVAVADSADRVDACLLGELASPGLNRAVRQTFAQSLNRVRLPLVRDFSAHRDTERDVVAWKSTQYGTGSAFHLASDGRCRARLGAVAPAPGAHERS